MLGTILIVGTGAGGGELCFASYCREAWRRTVVTHTREHDRLADDHSNVLRAHEPVAFRLDECKQDRAVHRLGHELVLVTISPILLRWGRRRTLSGLALVLARPSRSLHSVPTAIPVLVPVERVGRGVCAAEVGLLVAPARTAGEVRARPSRGDVGRPGARGDVGGGVARVWVHTGAGHVDAGCVRSGFAHDREEEASMAAGTRDLSLPDSELPT